MRIPVALLVALSLACTGGDDDTPATPSAPLPPEPPPVGAAPPDSSQLPGNPPQWCREGFFPAEGDGFAAVAVTEASERLHFLDDSEGCPATGDCVRKAYLVPGDLVLINRTLGAHHCAWYTNAEGRVTVGWLPAEGLATAALSSTGWVGEWSYGSSDLTVSRKADGSLQVEGIALWHGMGDNVHIGEVTPTPLTGSGTTRAAQDGECALTLERLGDWLIVNDNMQCGGMNVTFRGVYRR